MELTQLKSFVAVAKQGHLTRAAETLHLSQPAVSGQIKALEETLGVTLFERSSSGMLLTSSGRRLLTQAENVIGAAQELGHVAQSLRGQLTGRLRLGTVLDPAFLRLGELLARTVERHPQLELDLHHVLSNGALTEVRSGELDASFYFGTLPPDLSGMALRKMAYRVAIPIAWADELKSAPWSEFVARPWIITPPESSHRQLVAGLFGGESKLPARIIEADNESVITNLIESAVGVSLVREEIARASATSGRIAIGGCAEVNTTLWLVHARDRDADPRLLAMLDMVREVWADQLEMEAAA